jgi:CRP-like cAMP-binding protein
MAKIFSRIPYLNNLNNEEFHALIYKFERARFDKNDILLREKDMCDELIIVEDGEVELFIEVEGLSFVILRLGPESIINYQSIFLLDKVMITMRCSKDSSLLVI